MSEHAQLYLPLKLKYQCTQLIGSYTVVTNVLAPGTQWMPEVTNNKNHCAQCGSILCIYVLISLVYKFGTGGEQQ